MTEESSVMEVEEQPKSSEWNGGFPSVHRTDRVGMCDFTQCELSGKSFLFGR